MFSKQHFVSAALLVTMTGSLITPAVVSANTGASESDYSQYSVDQLESLIAKLQKQLAQTKQGSKCYVSDKDLSLGDGEPGDGRDGEVRQLQTFLKEKGHFSRNPTGYFGKVTKAALQAYQKANGVPFTGEFDPETRGKMHSQYCKKALKKAEKEVKKIEQKSDDGQDSATGSVSSISLSMSGSVAHWTEVGSAPKGFKVVWSKASGPTYPTRDGDKYNYLSDPSASESSLDAFDGAGMYYVRVCEYLGGACGVYSNQVTVNLQ